MRHLRKLRPIAVLSLIAFLISCTRWSAARLEPQLLRDRIRVTLDSGVKVVLERPAILGDSLVGYDPERHSIPLAHVKLVEVRRADDDATVALVLGLFAVGFIAVIVAATNAPSVHF